MGQLLDQQAVADEKARIEARIRLLEQQKSMEEGLPHLYGWPWYQWAWDFFTSTNRFNLLCAANQISKSSTQIRKCIHWATAVDLWPKLWRMKPTQFWYFYPTFDVATAEFHEKWKKEFLPRGEWKDHAVYGWKEEIRNKQIYAIYFNSGVTVYFKSYEQKAENLQTASVYAMFCDEECPEELYPEIVSRISAATIRGYFHLCFTATLGQEFWRLAIEEKDKRYETFQKALKLQVSLYMCKQYMDGSPGPWTDELIEERIEACADDAEVQRRVFGKFVVDKNRKYGSFSRKVNLLPAHPLPKDWLIYAGVDIGSGGESGHPAAIAFVGVRTDFTEGRVFKGWRGDKILTTAGDILDQYVKLRGKMKPVAQYYDSQARDFGTIAGSRKIPFLKADKGQDRGENTLNTLFKLGMLGIYDEPELLKLVLELESVRRTTGKSDAKDDFIDALRFAVMCIPWDFEKARKRKLNKGKADEEATLSDRERFRRGLDKKDNKGIDLIEAEIDLANEAYGYYDEDSDFEI